MSSPSLLNKWLNRKKPAATPVTEKTPADDPGGVYPLSRGQERLWFLTQTNPDNPFYNYAERYLVEGPLDATRLETAFRQVASRHGMMRTTFALAGEGPRQYVGSETLLAWEYREMPGDTEAAIALGIERARQPFDLQGGPLTRVLLVGTGEESHVLIVTQHHIVTDKWSMRILLEEVARAYREPEGVVAAPAPQLSYGTYAVRQRSIESPDSVAYWKEQLAGAPALLELPTDRPRPRQLSYRGAFTTAPLSPALSERIRQRCRELETTPYNYLLAAYLLMLYRYSGQEDLLVGTPVSNRDSLELERVIGFFNESVVVRAILEENLPFSELVRRVRDTMLEAFQHKNAPFESIVREVNPVRHPGANPLFQAMFILHKLPEDLEFGARTRAVSESLDIGVTKFDLTLFIADTANCFSATFEYATDLFDADRVDRMLGHFDYILQQVTEQPGLRLSEIDLLPPAELELLLAHPFPEAAPRSLLSLDQQITAAAASQPDATAVTCGSERLTYGELVHRATALAAGLLRRGLRPGEVVGLHTPRSVDTVIGLYGILKAGGAYLPLDPTYPVDRLRYMLEDSGARWLVTHGPLADPDAVGSIELVRMDEPGAEPADSVPEFPTPDFEDPAYLIYTSGSSGQPKGVVISHRNLVFSNGARAEVYGTPPTAFLLLSSFSFDSSVAGIFWTLAGGGKLVIAPERAEQDMRGLARLIDGEGITHTLLLPSLYGQLLEQTEGNQLQQLRTVIVAGEACSPGMVEGHFATLPSTELYNEYGPTEATVWATAHRLTPADAHGSVPIGQPIPFTRVFLTLPNGRLAPLGVAGELCIAGEGVAAGYWRRPALTDEKFSALVLPDGTSVRVYRTGDRATWRADGRLLFQGRQDQQVKVRGYRVELGEIRSQLLREAGIRDAEVAVADGRRLVAYLLAEADLDASTLQRNLQQRMPSYMVPTRFFRLEAFPRLPNGKVDLQALTTGDPGELLANDPGTSPPETEAERRLLDIWKEVLGTPAIGVTDNFFSLGGDSILSIQLLSRARRAGLEFPPTAIFDRQTVRELAAVARHTADGPPEPEAPTFTGALPLTPIQYWFFEEHRTAPHHWNHAWRLPLDPGVLPDAVIAVAEAIVEHNEALRQNFIREGGEWRSVIRPHRRGRVFSNLSGTEEEAWASLSGVQAEWNLEDDLLFRVFWLAGEQGGPPSLVLLAHHLVIDMVSWEAILKDLADGLVTSDKLPRSRGAAFHRWPRQLEDWAAEGKFDRGLAFWQQQVDTQLPVDHPGTLPVRQATIATEAAVLDEPVTRAFLQSANAAYGTRPEELLLAALLLTLREYTGSGQHCVNLERHGREPLDSGLPIQETTGWFTASYPLTFALAEGGGHREAIVTAKEQLRAVPGNGIGYGVLRYLARKEGLEQSPAVFCNYLGQRSSDAGGPAGRAEFLSQGLRHPAGEVNRVWEINSVVEDGRLHIQWSYSRDLHDPQTIVTLLAFLGQSLSELIHHCGSINEPVLTPSDFPDAGLSDTDLEGLLGELNL
ncbi:amino acid adenylation domain-containing protein/non-ribosomal peptide synthase protein (TIGR01720 family) [Lewinella marina]|uniref:Carrier domain-containing protein n=1 Tax=Neolewinella marina TaxID=438751 RepID=A0A2G0CDI0_9BACT|nr:non-ribosomal peptide synthetase [Neolewinella marina]NJB85991.1 amino acid adenylation domain-containing protein/non-ribosomal peptide synthase protein (TIGR01720 family) [Neolewinella marina]PHK98041.1 hypothetical protein CGL56_12685 [Neolewinella marina]